jgi:hypothetical protein
VVPIGKVLEIHVPAELFRERTFVVDGKLAAAASDRLVQLQVLTKAPEPGAAWDAKTPLVGVSDGPAFKQLIAGLAEFRRIFPPNICYPHVIPLDEVVCLKTFHREDEPLMRLFLSDEQAREIDRLWDEHRFIAKFPAVENEYLPLFIGFVTQDQPKTLVDFFENRRPEFQKRADDFQRDFEAAASKQLRQIFDLAARAYRRPLDEAEVKGLVELYQ